MTKYINLHSTTLLLLFIAPDDKQQQTGLKALRVENVYGNALTSAFALL